MIKTVYADNEELLKSRVTCYNVEGVLPGFDWTMAGQDFMYCNISSGELIVGFDGPTEREVSQFANGDIDFRSVVIDGVTMMCVKPGNLNWMDTACDYNPDDVDLTLLPDGIGRLFSIILVDASNGRIVKMRAVSVGTVFSNTLTRQLWDQIQQEIYGPRLLNRVNGIYSRFSTKDLVKMARNYYRLKAA